MNNPLRRLKNRAPVETRAETPLSIEAWADYFTYGGFGYPFSGQYSIGNTVEEPAPTFSGYVGALVKSNPVIWSLIRTRSAVFSEARFTFRNRDGKGRTFGTEALRPLEEPQPGLTTGHMLTRALQDVDIAGNAYFVRRGNEIHRLRPDWVQIIVGSNLSPNEYTTAQWDARIIGYVYFPGGTGSGKGKQEIFLPDEVAHFAPIPDPIANFRGMSWLTPSVRDAMGDNLATEHKISYLENGATPNMVVTLGGNITDPKVMAEFVDQFESSHGGVDNAFKTMYLTSGTSVDVVGTSLKEADFSVVSKQGENRLAVAAGVPGIIAGLSEGLEASTYSNYGQARRSFCDLTIWPLWREMCGAFAKLVDVPGGAELWIDTKDIAFLQEDAQVRSEIFKADALAVKALGEVGFQHESIVEAVQQQDLSKLEPSGTLVSHNLILNPELRLDPKYAGLFSEAPNTAAAEEATGSDPDDDGDNDTTNEGDDDSDAPTDGN